MKYNVIVSTPISYFSMTRERNSFNCVCFCLFCNESRINWKWEKWDETAGWLKKVKKEWNCFVILCYVDCCVLLLLGNFPCLNEKSAKSSWWNLKEKEVETQISIEHDWHFDNKASQNVLSSFFYQEKIVVC
jgi:hypothetical protein